MADSARPSPLFLIELRLFRYDTSSKLLIFAVYIVIVDRNNLKHF